MGMGRLIVAGLVSLTWGTAGVLTEPLLSSLSPRALGGQRLLAPGGEGGGRVPTSQAHSGLRSSRAGRSLTHSPQRQGTRAAETTAFGDNWSLDGAVISDRHSWQVQKPRRTGRPPGQWGNRCGLHLPPHAGPGTCFSF
jgi:hypothetical protein